MGSFSCLTFNDYPIFEYKNSYAQEAVDLLFLPQDYVSEERPNSSLNVLVWGEEQQQKKGSYTFKGFRQTAKVCRQRLEIYGISYSKAKKEFEAARIVAKEEGFYGYPIHKLSYRKYLQEIRTIISSRNRDLDVIVNALYGNITDSLITGELSIVGQPYTSSLYSILSVIPDDAIVEYDLSEVIGNGWVNETQALDITIEKIIVLTEGRTDVEFISSSLQFLYPHLYPYYHFMNFDDFKVESNASALVKFVISLAASNIKHPILVLFDNDTTGILEMKRLLSVRLGANFKVLKYPDLKSVKKYPTIGPAGTKKMDINGLACGIEMYLGSNVLLKEGKYIPVRWKAYIEKENKYQGELSEKAYVQDVFRKIIKSGHESDFSSMQLILQMMFCAFQ